MMTPAQLLDHCQALGIRLTLEGERLVVDAPKGALSPELTATLKAMKPELLGELSARAGDGMVEPPVGMPVRASFGQERLWIVDRWSPGGATWLFSSVIELDLAVDDHLLGRAIELVALRHAVLRTVLVEEGDSLVQRILPPDGILRLETPADAAVCHAAERAEAVRPMDLGREPHWRVVARRLGDRVRLQSTIHHASFDGWSGDLLHADMANCYAALAAGQTLPGPTAASYAAWSAWQRRQQAKPAAAESLAWWKRTLAGLSPLDLPSDRPRPPLIDERGEVLRETWTGLGLADVGRQLKATPFMLFTAALATLFTRCTGEEDIGLGIPIANREPPAAQGTIGYLVNLAVLRIATGGNPTYAELVGRVRGVVNDALQRSATPFERVVDALSLPRDPSRTPLFSVLVDWQRAAPAPAHHAWPERGSERISNRTSAYEFGLHIVEGADRIDISWEYRSSLFDAGTVRRWMDRLRGLLVAVLADPQCRLGDAPMVGVADRALIDRVNATDIDLPSDVTLVHLLRAQAARTPERVAVERGDVRLTYGEVHRRAERLARALAGSGVRPGSLVGLCLSRDEHLPVVLLGVLLAGAGYLPLDPAFPRGRLALMIEDGRPAVVLSDSVSAESLPSGTVWQEASAFAASEPAGSTEPGTPGADDPGYVLFTSGSTGRPKGVVVTQRNLANFLIGMPRVATDLSGPVRTLAITTLSFDIHVVELLLPLVQGGSVVVADRQQALDPHLIADLVLKHGVDLLQATPATWQMLLDSGRVDDLPCVRLSGGEAMTPALAERLLAAGRPVWNGYGPTETTVYCTVERISSGPITVGVPFMNTVLDIRDAEFRELPPGVEGEVWIGGALVARGYLGRDDLTAERFRDHPTRPGQRTYSSGDRGWITDDGRLVITGRMDHQVKLRGFRIELGEIEAAFSRLPAVAHVAVLLQSDGGGRLAAFATPRNGERPQLTELKPALLDLLPGYMVPNTLTWLDEIPQTPNGKLDRIALARIAVAPPAPDASLRPPQPGPESVIAEVFAEIIPGAQVGRDSSFFELGGHSLLAVKAVARLAAHGLRLTPADLIQQTVAQLAGQAGQAVGVKVAHA